MSVRVAFMVPLQLAVALSIPVSVKYTAGATAFVTVGQPTLHVLTGKSLSVHACTLCCPAHSVRRSCVAGRKLRAMNMVDQAMTAGEYSKTPVTLLSGFLGAGKTT